MSQPPYHRQGYNSPPKKGLPVWTLAILVFAAVFVVGMLAVIILVILSRPGAGQVVTQENSQLTAIPVPAGCFNSGDLVFQNQVPSWNGVALKEGSKLCIQGKIAKVNRSSNPAELYFYPSTTNSESNVNSYLGVRLTFELSFMSNALDKLEGQTIRVKSFTDHGPGGWFIPIRDYDWFEVVSFPGLKAEIKPR